MGWTDPPQAGDQYQRGKEIRTVYDRSLGGDVLYATGQHRRRRYQVTEAEWHEWVTPTKSRHKPARKRP